MAIRCPSAMTGENDVPKRSTVYRVQGPMAGSNPNASMIFPICASLCPIISRNGPEIVKTSETAARHIRYPMTRVTLTTNFGGAPGPLIYGMPCSLRLQTNRPDEDQMSKIYEGVGIDSGDGSHAAVSSSKAGSRPPRGSFGEDRVLRADTGGAAGCRTMTGFIASMLSIANATGGRSMTDFGWYEWGRIASILSVLVALIPTVLRFRAAIARMQDLITEVAGVLLLLGGVVLYSEIVPKWLQFQVQMARLGQDVDNVRMFFFGSIGLMLLGGMLTLFGLVGRITASIKKK